MPPFPFKSLEKEKENPRPLSLSRNLQMKINKQKLIFLIKKTSHSIFLLQFVFEK
jgi:hypothetical protein